LGQLVSAEDAIIEAPNIRIMIEGSIKSFNDTPIIMNGRILLPLRETLVSLGVKNDEEHIRWDQSTKLVYFVNDNDRVSLNVGRNIARVNGINVQLDTPPVIYKEKTYIPVRFVAQSLGKKVEWDKATSTVKIKGAIVSNVKGDSWTVKKNRPSGNENITTEIHITDRYEGILTVGISQYTKGLKIGDILVTSNNINKAVTVGDKIFMIDNDGKVREYDPETDTWVINGEIQSIKESNGLFSLVSIDNKIYVVGANYTDIGVYDIYTKQYTIIAKLPTPRIGGGAIAVGNNIYITGGVSIDDGSTLDTLEMYDTTADKWIKKKDAIQTANFIKMVYANDRIYFISAMGELHEYDIRNDTWIKKTFWPVFYIDKGMEAVNGKVYIFYQDYSDKDKSFVLEFDPLVDKWTIRALMNLKSNEMGATVLNGEIYTIDGSSVEKYTPPSQ
jgi:hypothetical protein